MAGASQRLLPLHLPVAAANAYSRCSGNVLLSPPSLAEFGCDTYTTSSLVPTVLPLHIPMYACIWSGCSATPLRPFGAFLKSPLRLTITEESFGKAEGFCSFFPPVYICLCCQVRVPLRTLFANDFCLLFVISANCKLHVPCTGGALQIPLVAKARHSHVAPCVSRNMYARKRYSSPQQLHAVTGLRFALCTIYISTMAAKRFMTACIEEKKSSAISSVIPSRVSARLHIFSPNGIETKEQRCRSTAVMLPSSSSSVLQAINLHRNKIGSQNRKIRMERKDLLD